VFTKTPLNLPRFHHHRPEKSGTNEEPLHQYGL
jgi:hypothetical protein